MMQNAEISVACPRCGEELTGIACVERVTINPALLGDSSAVIVEFANDYIDHRCAR